jgi:CSLREA domain-containing protein
MPRTGVRWLVDRNRRPTLRRDVTGAVLAVSALLAVLGATPARAADLLVTSLADEVTPGNGCSLREAMANADADAQVHPDCAAGLGPDTISFAESGTITLTLGALPTITSVAGLVIDGGPELVTISGGGRFRHFVVQPDEPRDAGWDLTLRFLVLANDGNNCGAGPGGLLTNIGYNLEDRSTCGFIGNHSLSNQENPLADPPIDNLKLASSLADNGGRLPSLALGSQSVAIDHVPFVVPEPVGLINCAELAVIPDDLPLDEPLAIDGRLLRRPARAGQACDAGAFEFRSGPGSPPPVATCHGRWAQGSPWGNGRCSPWGSDASD